MTQLPFTVDEAEAYIRESARRHGIDPDIAVRVAKSEGLQKGTWQSDFRQPYGREMSYGPFQLHDAPKGANPGLGNAFRKQTGLDPSDPANWQASTDFALQQARQGGWGPWMGAKRIGVTGFEGIGRDGQAALAAPAAPASLMRHIGGAGSGPPSFGAAPNMAMGAGPGPADDGYQPLAQTGGGADAGGIFSALGKIGESLMGSGGGGVGFASTPGTGGVNYDAGSLNAIIEQIRRQFGGGNDAA